MLSNAIGKLEGHWVWKELGVVIPNVYFKYFVKIQ